jgi:response regulator RpfG family c-di-GMP phosphodiesterase
VEVGLPKIYGFEVCKRLKLRPETKRMKFILVSSVYDKDRYKREPASLYDADDYIEEHRISDVLIDAINALRGKEPARAREEKAEKPPEAAAQDKVQQVVEPQFQPGEKREQPSSDEKIERARRLARTIISDIYLYNTVKADEAIKNNTFYAVFAAEIKEGLKLYDSRIAQEVRAQSDFFREAITQFIDNKKKIL